MCHCQITLAVEYYYFKRKEERKTSSSDQVKDTAAQKTQIGHTAEASIYPTSTDFSPLVPYKYLAVGFIGSIWGVVPAVSLALIASSSSSTSPSTAAQIFGFATLPAVIGGSVLALWADRKFGMEKARMRLRLPLAAIFGIIGGVIFPLLTPLIACLAITIIDESQHIVDTFASRF